MALPTRPPVRHRPIRVGALLAAGALVLAACGSEDGDTGATATIPDASPDAPVVLASTTIWADVVSNVACGELQVESLVPLGVDAHDFEPSVQEADQLRDADLVVFNGLGLEEGLEDTILDAGEDGVEVLEVGTLVTPIEFSDDHGHSHGGDEPGHDDEHGHGDEDHGHSHGERGDDEHGHGDDEHGHGDEHGHDDEHGHGDDDHGHDDEHGDGEHGDGEHGDGDDHGHTHEGDDPHVWMDPARVAQVVPAIEAALAGLDGLPVDEDELAQCAGTYTDELGELSDEMAAGFVALSPEQRRLVTNHEALGYLADAFDLEVIGTVIPSTSTLAEPNARELDELADTMEAAGVTRIYGEVTGSNEVADALADRLGDAEVVALYTESLGPEGSAATTYVEMMRANAELITGRS